MGIVGVGLLGASIGLGLRERGYRGRLVGVGRSSQSLARAQGRGAVDEVSTDAAALEKCDLIILATPISVFERYLEAISALPAASAAALAPPRVVTDVGSTKRSVVERGERLVTGPRCFVGSHPMAGSDRRGPEAASADLFDGKPVIVTPTAKTDPSACEAVERLWCLLGMRVLKLSPREHDRAVAWASHLPHAAAVMLVDLARQHDALDVASTGFGDTTRIAAGDPAVWADIFLENADEVGKAFEAAGDWLREFGRMVREGKREEVMGVLEGVKGVREGWGS